MKKTILLAACAVIISGCDTDGAPNYTDVNNIVVDGKSYTAHEYVKSFCLKANSEANNNCINAGKQENLDSLKPIKVKPRSLTQ